ncbi:TPA: hypothetical protein GL276_13480 [Klebsiella pneumoniae]|uniref:hypothetical protein n=1 Tax=Klebsiella pneumoniae TaxID=573 RepID=UPI000CD26D71|nr:hypothetical protein [Klebsiella pneumoniae]HDU4529390.1 hypothetical protein [Klebsiella pneumoniae subsp. pneumoniae]AUU95484.1 hypothetical protein C2U49_12080 [Klebsiella pneumoniae]EIV9918508.1 hypothetical protein [Klebsiella pneumoniae]MDU1440731.1 hypothetical protein [Klebsiella pneumoniae]POW81942.1 hypothetical protein C3413_13000 [Klebsiella pneumoniae]
MSIDYFDIEELLSAMYGITDEQRNDGLILMSFYTRNSISDLKNSQKLFRSCCNCRQWLNLRLPARNTTHLSRMGWRSLSRRPSMTDITELAQSLKAAAEGANQ